MNLLEQIKNLMNFIGSGNILTIVTFIVSLFIGYYLYFKSMYRLVYSSLTICKDCIKISDWKNVDNIFKTRLLIFNNGRKTINTNQIENLHVSCSHQIKNVIIKKHNGNLKIKTLKNITKIILNNMDSGEFVVIDFIHQGNITIEGRISETGKILETEPKNWIIINGVFILPMVVSLFYNSFTMLALETPALLKFSLNLSLMMGTLIVLRFIHRLFFIPDKISGKYLCTKDKFSREFKC